MDWLVYPNFSKEEFDCKHTGLNRMRPKFLAFLQQIRTIDGRPMSINSGYRDKTHPLEAKKIAAGKPAGEHYLGFCADINADRIRQGDLFCIAWGLGIRRIGLDFDREFIHIGVGDMFAGLPSVPWTY